MTFSKNSGVMVLPSRSTPSPSIQNTGILPFTPSAPQQMSHVSGFLICSAASTCGCAGRISNGSASTRGKPCHRSLAALNPKPLTRPLPKIDFARGQRRPGAPPLRRAPAGGGRAARGERRAGGGGALFLDLRYLMARSSEVGETLTAAPGACSDCTLARYLSASAGSRKKNPLLPPLYLRPNPPAAHPAGRPRAPAEPSGEGAGGVVLGHVRRALVIGDLRAARRAQHAQPSTPARAGPRRSRGCSRAALQARYGGRPCYTHPALPPPPRTNRTSLVPPLVLIGHAASFTPYIPR